MLNYFSAAVAAALGLLLVSPLGAQQAPVDQSEPSTIESKADQGPTRTPPQATDQPPLVEKVRRYVEDNPIVKKLEGDGFYPRFGGLGSGSGLAGGGGYRQHAPWAYVDVSVLGSTKAYRGIDARARWVQTASQSFEVWTNLAFRNNTQDDFYGLGMDASEDSRVDYGIRSTDVGARAIGRVRPWLRIGADLGYFMPSVRHGRDDNLPSIEQVFNDVTAPGLARQPDFLHQGVFAEIDSRDAAGFPHRGGLYRTAYSFWNDRTFNEYDFRRFDIEGSQFFTVAPKDVVAVRLALAYANNKPGDRVPFYLLPYVGGGDTVRAFGEFRFRDENAGTFNVELRHRVHKMVHVAGFVDWGKVANDWQDINLRDLKRAYGFGVRAGTDKRVFARLDVGFGGGEGTRLFLKFSPSF
jgi:hypothetical protein